MMMWEDENGGSINLGEDVEFDYGDEIPTAGRLSSRSPQQSQGSGRTSRIGSDNWLRENALKRAQNLKDLEKKELEKRTVECTFHPKINKRPLEKQPTRATFDRLSTNIQEVYRKREEEKKKIDSERILRECTFHPRLSQETEEFVRRKRTGDRMEQLGEKLYNDAKEYEKRHREKCRQATEREMDTLRPASINRRSYSSSTGTDVSHKPLHERLDDIKKAKAKKMKDLAERWSEDVHLTFKPSLCARSRSVDHHRSHTPDKYDECCTKQPGYVEMAEVQERPTISRRSSQIASQSAEYQQHTDFVERQQWHSKMHNSRIASKLHEKNVSERPSKPKRTQSEIDNITQRMVNRDKAWVTNRKEKLKYLKEESMKGYFRPRITKRASSADNRSANGLQRPTREDFVEKYKEELRKKEEKENTYKPQIDERSRRLAEKSGRTGRRDFYSKSDETMQALIRKRQQELKPEADECTFRPQTNRSPSPALQRHVSDQSISGFQQFVQRQEYARRCEVDRKRREENLHKVQPTALANLQRTADGRALSTQPEPFKLSKSTRPQKEKEDEASHQPRTNEKNRDRVLYVCLLCEN
eukprot:TRINITY_DN4614_c0_g2_i2.p1 TRINITY_DN4614_c0_g2~~TRINITY_DN4614_c0_g2_i2.p1  ORF type:complete len:587 (+),score=80.35 TRINITY_DN4614_c0_g2_i2:242-2002(+)